MDGEGDDPGLARPPQHLDQDVAVSALQATSHFGAEGVCNGVIEVHDGGDQGVEVDRAIELGLSSAVARNIPGLPFRSRLKTRFPTSRTSGSENPEGR